MQYWYSYHVFGIDIYLVCDSDYLCALLWSYEEMIRIFPQAVAQKMPLHEQAIAQLELYFSGRLKYFNLPISLKGSVFQEKVWRALLKVPYGQSKNYSDLALEIGRPKAARAVGTANGRNILGIVVPCHRIIAKNGSLAGFAGGLLLKERLLKLEKSFL